MSVDHSPEARAARGRANVAKRWDAYRAERIAAGLPPTKQAERGRESRFLEADVEPFWLGELERLGLTLGLDRTQQRVQAKELADSSTAEAIRIASDDGPSVAPTGDDAAIEAYYRGEVARWRRRAERDRKLAAAHEARADDAARELGTLLLRRGVTP